MLTITPAFGIVFGGAAEAIAFCLLAIVFWLLPPAVVLLTLIGNKIVIAQPVVFLAWCLRY